MNQHYLGYVRRMTPLLWTLTMLRMRGISEKSNFPHIFADINDNCIRPMVISFIYHADINRLDVCSDAQQIKKK